MLKKELRSRKPEACTGAGEVPAVDQGKGDHRVGGVRLTIFKGLILSALVSVTLYGMLNRGLFGPEPWLAVAIAILSVLIAVRFMGVGYFADLTRPAWTLVGLLAALVAVKGLSLIWTVSPIETYGELLRSSVYLAVFALAATSLPSRLLVGPFVDSMSLIAGAVAGWGVLQKTNPTEFPPTSFDGVRVDSTLGYPNTVAVVLGMGIALGLGRMTGLKNPVARGLYATLILVLGAILYFTFSRGGMLSLGAGLVVLFIVGERRLQMLANLLLVLVPLAWLLVWARDLKTLFSYTSDDSLRAIEGAAFRTDFAIAILAAFVMQVGFAVLIGRYGLTPRVHRALGTAAVATVVVVAGIVGYSIVDRELSSGGFFNDSKKRIKKTEDVSQRLVSFGASDNRSKYWIVAWEEWKEHPLTGTGAGTFANSWLDNRPDSSRVKQVHNVYLEQGTETGVFAFLALLGFAVLLVLYASRAAWRASGEQRVLLSGLVAAVVVYLVSSGLEWHWYIPASTIFFFALAGATAKFASKPEWEALEEASV